MKKVTLRVNGQDMAFSEKELISIVEKHLSRKTTQKTAEVVQKPTEGKWFEVKPQSIDQKLFERKREDRKQELARQLILEAFAEMKENPEKYGRSFKTMMPKKTWACRTVAQLKEMSGKWGDHMANWVEQALEWAQRIANGETWEELCNKPDITTNWVRLVVWRDANACIVGSGRYSTSIAMDPMQNVVYLYDGERADGAVPLIVLYDE